MPAKNGRNVSLTDEQSAFVDQLVESGQYASASEVVRDGLRLLQGHEHSRLLEKWLLGELSGEDARRLPVGVLERARQTIQEKIRDGLADAERGDFVDGESYFANWEERLKARSPRRKRR